MESAQIKVDSSQTPISIIAQVSRVVTLTVDRITGDRTEVPLLVAAACVEALKRYQIESQIMFGQAAWVEVMEDQSVIWAGCWGQNIHIWVASQFGEVIDLNTSAAHRKRAHSSPHLKALYSPPILWSTEVPSFYRYIPEGVAELDITDEKDQRRLRLVLDKIEEKCRPDALFSKSTESVQEDSFPNEPILCPGRRILDDSRESFKYFDRALSVNGIPAPPI